MLKSIIAFLMLLGMSTASFASELYHRNDVRLFAESAYLTACVVLLKRFEPSNSDAIANESCVSRLFNTPEELKAGIFKDATESSAGPFTVLQATDVARFYFAFACVDLVMVANEKAYHQNKAQYDDQCADMAMKSIGENTTVKWFNKRKGI
jgi:hypothetical protein